VFVLAEEKVQVYAFIRGLVGLSRKKAPSEDSVSDSSSDEYLQILLTPTEKEDEEARQRGEDPRKKKVEAMKKEAMEMEAKERKAMRREAMTRVWKNSAELVKKKMEWLPGNVKARQVKQTTGRQGNEEARESEEEEEALQGNEEATWESEEGESLEIVPVEEGEDAPVPSQEKEEAPKNILPAGNLKEESGGAEGDEFVFDEKEPPQVDQEAQKAKSRNDSEITAELEDATKNDESPVEVLFYKGTAMPLLSNGKTDPEHWEMEGTPNDGESTARTYPMQMSL